MAPKPTLNKKLWDEVHGTHYFQINETLYLLDGNALSRSSIFISNLLKDGPTTGKPVKSKTVVIPDVKEAEFEIFALRSYGGHIIFPENGSELCDVLRKLLYLGHYFLSSSTLEYTFDVIEANLYRFSPAELVHFCHRYDTKRFAEKAFAFERLLVKPFSDLKFEDAQSIGLEGLLIVAKAKENIHLHLHNIACNAPHIKHGDACINNTACDEDWNAVWWNIMGRNLLDAEHPVSWGESSRRLRQSEFGRMGHQCRDQIMNRVTSDMTPFRGNEIRDHAAQKFIDLIEEVKVDDA